MPTNEELEGITIAEVKEFLNFLDRVEEVKVVRLQPGDIIVCKTDDRVTTEGAARVQSALKRVFPDHEVLITSSCSIEVARPEHIDGSEGAC